MVKMPAAPCALVNVHRGKQVASDTRSPAKAPAESSSSRQGTPLCKLVLGNLPSSMKVQENSPCNQSQGMEQAILRDKLRNLPEILAVESLVLLQVADLKEMGPVTAPLLTLLQSHSLPMKLVPPTVLVSWQIGKLLH